ncbi:sigma-70 RNA polymerase sigma factor region 4 domain-containing protein [Mucilaginibacter conchicola]|uniref:sigma-70 family RNA polymerase sigma factor n=1 Tax=Mucilaginibacter conchicola TaxID=2303333 RepID=UPI0011C1BCD8|nr:sigma-70 family RNA polymerase sigma factor [Mucilaginibacter conchicola]
MREQLTFNEAALPSIKQAAHELYTNYGAMLLGYIIEVVKDRPVAEGYLADIFSGLSVGDIQYIAGTPDGSTYCRLQQYTRNKLVSFVNTVDDCADSPDNVTIRGNRLIDLMTAEQQLVFCGVHYHGKSVSSLANELNKTSDEIRQILKQSFNIIRSNRK